MSQKIVRMPSSLLRHCYELGEYVREAETRYVYAEAIPLAWLHPEADGSRRAGSQMRRE